MYTQSLLYSSTRVFVPLALLLSVYLYLYPIFNGCAFPSTDRSLKSSFSDTIAQHVSMVAPSSSDTPSSLAPFRLLVLADPQIEGDSSLPKPQDALLPKLRKRGSTIYKAKSSERVSVAVRALQDVILEDLVESLQGLRKRIDLFGNDYYLAHIFRTLNWWSKPTHITVLGDLIGSQWVNDDEFEWRGWRYWNRVFAGGEKVEDELITFSEGQEVKTFGLDDESWKKRIINLAGNHDIGYAGDISEQRMSRFERVFGKANWDVRFEYPKGPNTSVDGSLTPSVHLIVFNSMLLDSPALSNELQAENINYLNSIISNRVKPVEDKSSFTLFLTHVPLFKKEGVCVDAPFFDYWGDDDGGGVYKPAGLKEQNHLSQGASEPGILESIFGMKGDVNVAAQGKGRNGVILTGHDHEGCDVLHFIPANSTYNSAQEDGQDRQTQWEAVRCDDADTVSPHAQIREVTMRSMMGDFGGNAGLLSAWFDFDAGEWRYDIQMCRVGVQHIWWAVHIIDVVAVALVLARVALQSVQASASSLEKAKTVPGEKAALSKKK